MIRLGVVLLVLCWAMPAWATQYGWDFRATQVYVTDVSSNTYAIGTDQYPTTRNGITFGWVTNGPDPTNRDSTGDARLAGTWGQNAVGQPITFQVDLPASGSWLVTLAAGAANNAAQVYLQVKDNATAFITVDGTTTTAQHFFDATGVERTSQADWIANNVAVSRVFTSSTLNLVLGNGTTKTGVVAYLLISPGTKLQQTTTTGKLFSIPGGSGALQVK